MSSKKFIVIEGNIGAGKTTLAKKIALQSKVGLILEQFAENPFLSKFYQNPEKYAFPLELSFLLDRYNQFKNDFEKLSLNGDSFIVTDYYFAKSLIFAQANLEVDEYALYEKLFQTLYNALPPPDLYVYLHLSPPNLLKNIKKRGRNYEQSISLSYLEKIEQAYFKFFERHKNCKFLIIDTNDIDFVHNTRHYEQIFRSILSTSYKNGITKISLSQNQIQ